MKVDAVQRENDELKEKLAGRDSRESALIIKMNTLQTEKNALQKVCVSVDIYTYSQTMRERKEHITIAASDRGIHGSD